MEKIFDPNFAKPNSTKSNDNPRTMRNPIKVDDLNTSKMTKIDKRSGRALNDIKAKPPLSVNSYKYKSREAERSEKNISKIIQRRDKEDTLKRPSDTNFRTKNNYKSSSKGELKAEKKEDIVTPVILAREKPAHTFSKVEKIENKSVNVLKESTTVVQKDTDVSKKYQIAAKPNVIDVPTVEKMTAPVKFLDENLSVVEDLSNFLLDQCYFLVIAVVGMQGVGKSFISSMLANPVPNFMTDSKSKLKFKLQERDEILSGAHKTDGIDAFVTRDRIIVLDVQPLLSPSVMDLIVLHERKPSNFEYNSTENLLEIESLQLLAFAMNVSHVLVVVQDYFVDPNLLRLLHACRMMKPTISGGRNVAHSDSTKNSLNFDSYNTTTQYAQHTVMVHNRALEQHFSTRFVDEIKRFYCASLFQVSDDEKILEGKPEQMETKAAKKSDQSGIKEKENNKTVAKNKQQQHECPESQVPIFMVPEFKSEEECSVSMLESLSELRKYIFSLPRNPLTHVTLTEKSWYEYANRTWDNIRGSKLYIEYSKHLP